jgi:glycosyltransferase involved in cell wall biosynthesis
MRVLHLSHCYPPALGGSEVLMEQISTRLVREHGHQVTVITSTGYSTAPFRGDPADTMTEGTEVRDGVTVERFDVDSRLSRGLRRVHRPAWRLRLPGNSILRTLYDGPVSTGMLRAALSADADLIGATAFPLLHMHYAWLAAQRKRVPFVIYGALHPEDAWGYDRATVRWLARRASGYVAYTPSEAAHAEAMGVPSDRVRVIPPGIEPAELDHTEGPYREELGLPANAKVFGFIGQLGRGKGIFQLVQAFGLIGETLPDWHLVMAGANTNDVPLLEQEIALFPESIQRRIHIVRGFPLERKGDLYRALDVFVTPSMNESFGITTVEAWHCGVPVIATRLAAVQSFVRHGEDAILVQRGERHELAGAMVELAVDEGYREGLRANGLVRAQTLTWVDTANAVDGFYRELVG